MEFWITNSLCSPSVITTWKRAGNAEYETLQDAKQDCDQGRSDIFGEIRWSHSEWVDEEGGFKGSGLVTWQGLAGVVFVLKMPSKQNLKDKENIICSFDGFYGFSRSTIWVHSMQKNECLLMTYTIGCIPSDSSLLSFSDRNVVLNMQLKSQPQKVTHGWPNQSQWFYSFSVIGLEMVMWSSSGQ